MLTTARSKCNPFFEPYSKSDVILLDLPVLMSIGIAVTVMLLHPLLQLQQHFLPYMQMI